MKKSHHRITESGDAPAVSPRVALRAEGVDPAYAAGLAERLGIALDDGAAQAAEILLHLSPTGLSLRLNAENAPGAVCADFLDTRLQQRQHQSDLLAKATGLPRLKAPEVIDATAGLGRDAWVLAQRGCRVVMLERAPVVHALLADALERARNDPASAAVHSRVSLHQTAAAAYLSDSEHGADVVYLDPMFPDRRKSALVKKEMQLFQRLLGHDLDASEVLGAARARARYRVVVKRPLHGDVLSGDPPTFQLAGRSTRFDIYVNRGLPD